MDSENFPIGYSENLALFTKPPKDIALLQEEWVDYAPTNTITEAAPIEFNIEANSLKYIDLSKSLLNVKIRIVSDDGGVLPAADQYAPINLTLQSLWRQVDLNLGQVPIPSVGSNYPYKSIIDVLLSNGEDCKESQLQSQLYCKDTAGHMDETKVKSNTGYNWRYNMTSRSIIAEMIGPLFLDLAQQGRAMINGVSINLKLWPSSDQFRIMVDTKEKLPKLKIMVIDATLKLCQLTVHPEIMIAHENALSKSPALYPHLRSEIKTYSMAAGITSYRIDNLFNGEIPTKLVVGLVAGDAYTGNYEKNPFNFRNYKLNFLGFYIDNNAAPRKPFTPKFDGAAEGTYSSPFLALFGEKTGKDFGNYIHLQDFPRGYALYRFDISAEDHIVKKGNTRLELRFDEKLDEVVTVIVYAHFPSLLRIDKSRKVIL